VAEQTVFWTLPHLGAFLFSGLPGYSWPLIYPDPAWWLVSYAVLILILGVLFVISLKGKEPWACGLSGENRALYAILFSFVFSIIVYLAWSLFLRHSYQTWKFSSYVSLPLSFVPTALLFKAISQKINFEIKKIVMASVLILIFLCFSTITFVVPIKTFADRYYKLRSGSDFQELLQDVGEFIGEDKAIAFHSSKTQEYVMALNYFGSSRAGKIYVIESERYDLRKRNYAEDLFNMPTVYISSDYFKVLDKIDYIISDKLFDDIFNGKKEVALDGVLYVYDKNYIKTKGYVSFLGLARCTRETLGRYFRVNMRLPDSLRGANIDFSMSFLINNYDASKTSESLCSAEGLELYKLKGGVKTKIESEIKGSVVTVKNLESDAQAEITSLEGLLPEAFGFPDGPCSLIIDEIKAIKSEGE
jgi:hypothetical protein